MMQQLNQEVEQDETRNYRHHVGSPITNSPPGNWAQFGSPSENSPLQGFSRSPTAVVNGHLGGNHLSGLAPLHPPLISNSMKIAPIGKDQRRINNADLLYSNNNSSQGVAFQQTRALSDNNSGMMPNMSSRSIGTLNGAQFLWGGPTPYSDNSQTSAWQSPSMGHSLTTSGPGMGQGHGVPYPSRHGPFIASSQNHHYHNHVGSAPSRIRNFGYFPESPDASLKNPVAFGGTGSSRNEGSSVMTYCRSPINHAALLSGNISENGLANFRMLASQRIGPPKFYGNATYSGLGSIGYEGLTECNHSRRVDNIGSQLDSKKQYLLDLEKIVCGEDTRTTLMIKNIPNKYTSKMLLAAIDETHEGAYDFLYLPIDFKVMQVATDERKDMQK